LNESELNCLIKFIKQKKDLEVLLISNLISITNEFSASELSTSIGSHPNLKEVDVSNIFSHHHSILDFNNILMSKTIKKLTISNASMKDNNFQFWFFGLVYFALNLGELKTKYINKLVENLEKSEIISLDISGNDLSNNDFIFKGMIHNNHIEELILSSNCNYN
jgi:hypothetical protein